MTLVELSPPETLAFYVSIDSAISSFKPVFTLDRRFRAEAASISASVIQLHPASVYSSDASWKYITLLRQREHQDCEGKEKDIIDYKAR